MATARPTGTVTADPSTAKGFFGFKTNQADLGPMIDWPAIIARSAQVFTLNPRG
jgi:hypothetical protein